MLTQQRCVPARMFEGQGCLMYSCFLTAILFMATLLLNRKLSSVSYLKACNSIFHYLFSLSPKAERVLPVSNNPVREIKKKINDVK